MPQSVELLEFLDHMSNVNSRLHWYHRVNSLSIVLSLYISAMFEHTNIQGRKLSLEVIPD